MITNSIFILGAGSSAEYGLPLWKDLAPEMRKKLQQFSHDEWDHVVGQLAGNYSTSHDDRAKAILFCIDVLNAVDEEETFSTIDEAISMKLRESNAAQHNRRFAMRKLQTLSEVLFWYVMLLTFHDKLLGRQGEGSDYSAIDTTLWLGHHQTMGWLRNFIQNNSLLLSHETNMFIDFNYDGLFYAMYSYLNQFPEYFSIEKQKQLSDLGISLYTRSSREKKHTELNELLDRRISEISDGEVLREGLVNNSFPDPELRRLDKELAKIEQYDVNIRKLNLHFIADWRRYNPFKEDMKLFQPHGFFEGLNNPNPKNSIVQYGIFQNIDRSKSYRGTEPISCHDTRDKNFKEINQALKGRPYERLILMGVGPTSLRQNLDKIKFDNVKPKINEIWFTCFNSVDIDDYEDYFAERFGEKIDMKQFKRCEDLAKALAQEFGAA